MVKRTNQTVPECLESINNSKRLIDANIFQTAMKMKGANTTTEDLHRAVS